MKPDCHEVALRIDRIVKQFEITLEPFWLSHESGQIKLCDASSKEFDLGDYRLCSQDFSRLESEFGPFSVIFFASIYFFWFRPFYARLDCADAAGVEAFTAHWGEAGMGFFHPPVGLIVRVMRYAEACRADGLLVVPDWPFSVFCTVLRETEGEGKVVRVDRFRPYLESPGWMISNTFRRVPKSDFIAFLFEF